MASVPLFMIIAGYLLADPNAARSALAVYGVLWFLNRR